jgi:hypothetical protein
LPRRGCRYGPRRISEKSAGREEDLTGRETGVRASLDRSLSQSDGLRDSNGTTVAKLVAALARVPKNRTRGPRTRVETRVTGATAGSKYEHHAPRWRSRVPGTVGREALEVASERVLCLLPSETR